MDISVIIPTHNRSMELREALAALDNQSLSQNAYEIIVVDDGSEPTHRRMLNQYRPSLPAYRLYHQRWGGLASARNLGAERARGEILYFLDDDVIPGVDTLRQHAHSHRRNDRPGVVLGALPYPADMKLNAFLWYLERCGHFDLYRYGAGKYPGGKPPLPPLNGNSSLPREVFFQAGKYDESFRQYGGEDLELGYRLSRLGIPFTYNPSAVGYHRHGKDFSQLCLNMEQAGESLIRIYRMHPEVKHAKNIDVVTDPIGSLRGKKRWHKIILNASLALPWLLAMLRFIAVWGQPYYLLRYPLFPLYRWLSQYHYARGMRKGLRQA